jgi:sugar lactone lactonase YvrE
MLAWQRFRPYSVCIVLLVLAILLPAFPAAAQGRIEPFGPDPAPFVPSPQDPVQAAAEAATTGPADILALPPLPGPLTYGYASSYGVSGIPYFPDGYLNRPIGLATVGADLWVTELEGSRALKYNKNGQLLQEIGRVGQADVYPNRSLQGISDAAVDTAGNLWLTDENVHHVVQFDPTGNPTKRLGRQWNCTSDNDGFCYPSGIVIDGSGRIYISDGAPWWNRDRGNHRIQVFDAQGAYLTTIGTSGAAGSGPLQFDGQRRMALFGSTLYVADAGNDRVQILDVANPAAPALVGTLGVTGEPGGDNAHLSNPSGVAVNAQHIYVADTWNHRVQVFRRDTRAYVATIGTGWGDGNDQFRQPFDVAVDAGGMIYVADYDNYRVQVFNSQRQYVRTLGTTGVAYRTDARHLNGPWGIAVAPDGSFYVTEERGNRLIKIGPGGGALWTVGRAGVDGGWDGENDLLNSPSGVAVNAAGNVFVADKYNQRVQVFSAAGAYLRSLGMAGEQGSDNAHFNTPAGLAFGPDGALYVADSENHRIQIFDAGLNYRATLGVAGQAGDDNAHFRMPFDVAVGTDGTIYVADTNNRRVQVFNSQRQYVRTLGTTGVEGNEYSQFREPSALALDKQQRLFVADTWNSRIMVFDKNGVFLTSIGGRASTNPGGMSGPRGVAVDANGVVYVTNTWNNHTLDFYAPGVPDWAQRNLNGFGSPNTRGVASLEVFNGTLFAGSMDYSGTGARRIMRLDNGPTGPTWAEAVGAGFGSPENVFIHTLAAWDGYLYAGTQHWYVNENRSGGSEIWRSADGQTWTPVMTGGFGDTNNLEIFQLTPYSDTLLASVWNDMAGAQIWQSGNGTDWNRVASDGLGKAANQAVIVMAPFDGYLYGGTYTVNRSGEPSPGCEIWRSAAGSDWVPVVTGGLGGASCYSVQSLASFGGYLYAGTGVYDPDAGRYPGGQIWRCSAASGCDAKTDWEAMIDPGFGKPANLAILSLTVADGRLYATTYNSVTGMEVWRTSDGDTWEQVGFAGFGDLHNSSASWQNSVAVWEDTLWIGAINNANGGEVWQFQPERAALAIADPNQPHSLAHTRPDGSKLEVMLPSGALTETATLVLIGAGGPGAPQGYTSVGKPFSLDLVMDGEVQPGHVFSATVDVALTYPAAQVQGLDEAQLMLMVWNPATKQWEDAACGPVVRAPNSNQLTVPICHLSRFGLFAPVEQAYLPLLDQ